MFHIRGFPPLSHEVDGAKHSPADDVTGRTTVAVARRAGVRYPAEGAYGPPHAAVEIEGAGRWPENPVYGLVREALLAAGCDASRVGSPAWNPLADFVASGDRIHILPNFVSHRRGFEHDAETFFAKTTHASVLQPVIDYAIKAAGSPGAVSLGNAPIQGCDFQKVLADTGTSPLIASYYTDRRQAVTPVDLRGLHSTFGRGGALITRTVTDEPTVEIDLGTDSLLDSLYDRGDDPAFRVADYSAAATSAYHGRGRHVYVINKRVLDARLIVSVPKLKAHEKVGLTCTLKGTVGAIARKECLAHHRLGGPRRGGDEYPRDAVLPRLTSQLLEYVSDKPVTAWTNALRVVSTTAFRAFRILAPGTMGGSWFGNDTAWRMALDIARILRYATPEGLMTDVPQRRHIAIVDGIIAGEGDGPLHPSPRRDGIILFGEDPCLVDWAGASAMGWDPSRIPLLRESFRLERYRLTEARPEQLQLMFNGQPADLGMLRHEMTPPHRPPSGWRAHLVHSSNEGRHA